MPRKYQVESKLPEPVFIKTVRIERILSEDEYKSFITPISEEKYSVSADEYFYRPTKGGFGSEIFGEYEPGNVQLRSEFFQYYCPVELETGDIIPLERMVGHEYQAGDYVWYDVGVDTMTYFDETKMREVISPRKLTLIENEE